jgi:hypothetical protein
METEVSYPRFVNNSADGQDKFPEKSQGKVAKTIAELISKKEPKSKIIGLEGEWGSGKTNVIRMIESQLKKTHHLYIHDVWSYQEDLQRRTFLESLTSDLLKGEEPFLLKKNHWETKLKELLAKTRVTTTDTIPVFSPGFLFVICCIVLWTIAGDFSGPMYLSSESGELHKRAYVLIIALIGYLYFSFRSKKLLGPKDVFYIYNKQDTKKVVRDIIYESETSPQQFHEWLIDLQGDFSKNKELIVVFDNMDRLPKEKVAQFWSLIHTFFSEKHFEKVWVIVPYSRVHITKAFSDGEEEADHFIDKTFTIQIQVAPPISSD